MTATFFYDFMSVFCKINIWICCIFLLCVRKNNFAIKFKFVNLPKIDFKKWKKL